MNKDKNLTVSNMKVPGQVRIGDRNRRHLSQAVILEETGTPRMVNWSIAVSVAAVAAFITWSYFTEIAETAVSFGQIVPNGNVRVIQHLEGGIVRDILVSEGQEVAKSDTLVRLDEIEAAADAGRLQVRRAALQLTAERLRAIGENREPDFAFIDAGRFGKLINDNREVHAIQVEALEAKREVLRKQLAQAENDLAVLEASHRSTLEQKRMADERAGTSAVLLERKLISRDEHLVKAQEVEKLSGELARQEGEKKTLGERIAEVNKRLIDLDATRREQAFSELAGVVDELAEIDETLKKLEDRVSRLDVKAPVSGRIQDLQVNTIGSVLPAGGLLMKIVPVDETLVAEVRISPQDVGHVTIGQDVTVKVNAYDFARYGSVAGTLTGLSPTTFMDERNEPYYKGRVTLASTHVGQRTDTHILPGMTLQADIVTGQKTLLTYLLKPIYASLQQSFHER